MRSLVALLYSTILLSILLIGCNSNAQNIEFIRSYTMSEPVKNFNLVLENQGRSSTEISFEVIFSDPDVQAYQGRDFDLSQDAMKEFTPVSIDSGSEQTYGVTFAEDFPEELLEKMKSFTLTIYDDDGGEKIIHVEGE